jgi:hypothetical protein
MAGDLASLVSIATARTASDVYKYVFMSYRSQRMNPRDYNQTMVSEAEAWPTKSTDTAQLANATASNGNVARCTFATTTSNLLRLSTNVNRRGTYRIFARMWVDSSTTVRCYLQLKHYTGTMKGITVDVTSTTQRLFDLGAFQFSKDQGVPDMNFGITPQSFLEFFASRTSGAGTLYVDCFLMMPADEGFLKFTNTAPALSSSYAYVYDTTMSREQFGATGIWSIDNTYIDPTGPINGFGRMAFQPGAGTIQILVAHSSMEQSFDLSALSVPWPAVRAVPCYNTPRGFF